MNAAEIEGACMALEKYAKDETLMVMAQNPGNNYHWSKRVFEVSVGDLEAALKLALHMRDALREAGLANAQTRSGTDAD